jgi:hypothetical protein
MHPGRKQTTTTQSSRLPNELRVKAQLIKLRPPYSVIGQVHLWLKLHTRRCQSLSNWTRALSTASHQLTTSRPFSRWTHSLPTPAPSTLPTSRSPPTLHECRCIAIQHFPKRPNNHGSHLRLLRHSTYRHLDIHQLLRHLTYRHLDIHQLARSTRLHHHHSHQHHRHSPHQHHRHSHQHHHHSPHQHHRHSHQHHRHSHQHPHAIRHSCRLSVPSLHDTPLRTPRLDWHICGVLTTRLLPLH